jgi:hypothetical protein
MAALSAPVAISALRRHVRRAAGIMGMHIPLSDNRTPYIADGLRMLEGVCDAIETDPIPRESCVLGEVIARTVTPMMHQNGSERVMVPVNLDPRLSSTESRLWNDEAIDTIRAGLVYALPEV